jgi:hypothetical protein
LRKFNQICGEKGIMSKILVLAGGSVKGAFQVGVLKKWMGEHANSTMFNVFTWAICIIIMLLSIFLTLSYVVPVA